MFWIVLTGILSLGVIPMMSAVGFGFELLVNIFTPVSWGYWGRVSIGLIFALLPGVKLIAISPTYIKGAIKGIKNKKKTATNEEVKQGV